MRLQIDGTCVDEARRSARGIARSVVVSLSGKSTASVERSIARLCGVDGTDANGIPLANVLVDALSDREHGLANALGGWIAATGLTPQQVAERIAKDGVCAFTDVSISDSARHLALEPFIRAGIATLEARRKERDAFRHSFAPNTAPLLYVIVATGNIYEDCRAAVASAEAGADIIAVIRSTAQSLMDYVPYGPTTEGFGGTYATQENFRLMRVALDEASTRLGRYVMLTNYASGLCMPEIALLAAFEGLDILLNDAMYGVLFRDINVVRTFIDQHASRQIIASANIVINTGEDNYLTVADAVEHAPTVLASQFVNEALAHEAGLRDEQLGLGDAFEIDPMYPSALLLQIAQAQLTRQIFPNSPIKYMPPTRFITGDIFRATAINTLFNLTSVLTGQSIHLCGMMSEAIHNPHLADRALSIENANYVFSAANGLAEELEIRAGGKLNTHAANVLASALGILRQVHDVGLIEAIAKGVFADIRRAPSGGRGADGVFTTSSRYWNPLSESVDAI